MVLVVGLYNFNIVILVRNFFWIIVFIKWVVLMLIFVIYWVGFGWNLLGSWVRVDLIVLVILDVIFFVVGILVEDRIVFCRRIIVFVFVLLILILI